MYRKIVFLGAMVVLVGLAGIADAALDPNLVAWWKLNETSGTPVADSTGHGWSGTLHGGTWTNDPNFGRCLRLNGSSDYISIDSNDVTNTVNTQVTLAFWQNGETTAVGQINTVFEAKDRMRAGIGRFSKLNIALPYWSGAFHMATFTTSHLPSQAGNYDSWQYSMDVNDACKNKGWSHWSFTKSTTNGMKIYRNGTVYSSAGSSYTRVFDGDANSVYIGVSVNENYSYESLRNYYKGKLADIRLYNRELAAYEIANIYASTQIEPNLVAQYEFDDADRAGTSVADISGLGNTGTLTNGAKFANDPNRGQVAEFTVDDYVAVPNAAAQKLDTQVTVAFWHYGDTDQSTTQGTGVQVFEAKNSGGTAILSIVVPYFAVGGNKYVYWDTQGTGERTQATLSDSNWKGQWNHWAFTKDVGSGKTEIYLNGTLLTSGTGKTAAISSIDSLTIGDSASYSGVDGRLDDVRIYNKRLSKTEIEDIYNESVTDPNLVGWWKFDDGSGTTAADSSNRGYNGTLVVTPLWTADPNFRMCLQFDGAFTTGVGGDGDRVSLPNDVTNTITNQVTVACWQNGETTQVGTVNTVFSAQGKYTGTLPTKINVILPYWYSAMHFAGLTTAKASDGSNYEMWQSTMDVNDCTKHGLWSHWAFTKDPTNGMKIYRNGTVYASNTNYKASFEGDAWYVNIGANRNENYADDRFRNVYKGKLTDVRVYNKCLSQTAIDNIYDLNDGEFIVVKGQKMATIVFPDNAATYEVKAYQELADMLKAATGRTFVSMPESDFEEIDDGSKPVIYVGDCDATNTAIGSELDTIYRDGYMIVIQSNRVFLAGKYDFSTFWATVQFLEDYIGIRYLAPGSLFTDVLPRRSIILPMGHYKDEPVMRGRRWSGVNQTGVADWAIRQKIAQQVVGTPGNYPYIADVFDFHHKLDRLFPYAGDPCTFYDTNPEYYAYISHHGGRYAGPDASHSYLCWTNANSPAVAAQMAKNAFDADPDLKSFSLAPGDGMEWCECQYCVAKYAKMDKSNTWEKIWYEDANASDAVFSWINAAAVALHNDPQYADKLIGVEAYNQYTNPNDIQWTMDRKLVPYICFAQSDMYVPDYNTMHYDLMEEWRQRVDQWGCYDYAYGEMFIHPKLYVSLVQRIIQHAAANNGYGAYAETYPNFGLDGPRLYETARVWWNPAVNLTDIFNDWNERMYRDAAEPMKNFWQACEDAYLACDNYSWEPTVARLGLSGRYPTNAWRRADGSPIRQTGPRTSLFEVFTPAVIEECNDYMTEAEALAQTSGDTTVQQRIAFSRKCWNTSMAFSDAYWAGEGIDSLVHRDPCLPHIAAAIRKMPSSYAQSYFTGIQSANVGNDYVAMYPISSDDWAYMLPRSAEDNDCNKVADLIKAQVTAEGVVGDANKIARIDQIIDANFYGAGAPTHDLYLSTIRWIRQRTLDNMGLVENTPQVGLLVWYKFDETGSATAVADSSGHNNNGTLIKPQNDPCACWTTDLIRGKCLKLNGTEYIYSSEYDNNADFSSIYKEVTVAFWMKSDNMEEKAMFQANKWLDPPVIGISTGYCFSNCWYSAGGTSMNSYWSAPYELMSATATQSQYMNQWNHWAFTKNANNGVGTMTIYRNGTVAANVGSGRYQSMQGMHYLRVGRGYNDAYGLDGYFHGLMDDFRIYDTCLDSTSVQNLYNATNIEDSNLIGWWKFDKMTNGMAADEALRGNDGTLVNGASLVYDDSLDSNCLNLDGTDDHVSIPNDVTNILNNQVTIAFWQNGATTSVGQINTVFEAKEKMISGRRYSKLNIQLPYWYSTYHMATFITSHIPSINGEYDMWQYTMDVNDCTKHSEWSHWAFTKSTANGMKIYRNGSLYASNSNYTRAFDGDANSVYIGCSVNENYSYESLRNFYKGKLSDVRIYNTELNQTDIQNIMAPLGDVWPPTPNPATWSSAPAATSDTAITMTATTASDATGVEYKFTCTAGGGHSSNWQSSPTYTDTGLTSNTQYTYTVQYRDTSAHVNTGIASSPASATTYRAMPSYVSTGTVASGTTTMTPALPGSLAANDILLLFVETANQAVTVSNQNGGTWAEVSGSPQGTGTAGGTSATRLTVFWSRYNGSQGNPTTSVTSGNHQVGRMIAVRGCPTSGNPWDVTQGGVEATSDTSGSIPGTTTTVPNTFVVTAISTHYDTTSTAFFASWSNGNLASLTERIDNANNTGNGGGIGVATGTKATAGDYGSTSVTCAQNSIKGLLSIALLGK